MNCKYCREQIGNDYGTWLHSRTLETRCDLSATPDICGHLWGKGETPERCTLPKDHNGPCKTACQKCGCARSDLLHNREELVRRMAAKGISDDGLIRDCHEFVEAVA